MMDPPLKLFISHWIAVLPGNYPEVVTTRVVPLSPFHRTPNLSRPHPQKKSRPKMDPGEKRQK